MNYRATAPWQKDHRYNKGRDIVSEVKVVKVSLRCNICRSANDMGVEK